MKSLLSRTALFLALAALAAGAEPDFDINLTTMRSGFDGQMAWMNPMVGAIPRAGQDPILVLTLQKALLTESDVYFAVHDMRSEDFGRTWSAPVEREALGRRAGPDGMQVGIISLAPKWNAPSGKLLALGGTSFFIGQVQNREGPKRPAYSIYDPERREWTPWVPIDIPDEPKFHMADPGCCQRVDLPDGTILQPVYFKAAGLTAYSTTVLRCAFDGRKLTYLGQGDELTLPFDASQLDPKLSFNQKQFIARQSGLFEPSLARFGGRFYLTLRNVKDNYVAFGKDGQHFSAPRRWTFDDGGPLGSEDTQTHWASHGDRLYLVYTRRGAQNDHVFRHRAPIFIARVDPDRLVILRATERVLIPEHGAGLGNCIGVTEVNEHETWVTTAESMQNGGKKIEEHKLQEERGANNRSFAARIVWKEKVALDLRAREIRPAAPPSAARRSAATLLLQRPTCRIPFGNSGPEGAGWTGVAELPAVQATALRPETPPRTSVRALVQEDALCVRFECETKDPRTLVEGANGGDRVWIELFPKNDPVERLRFEEDFRGDRKIARLRRITGENSLVVVPDLWEAKAAVGISDADVPIYHGLKPGGWYAEFVIPWRILGLSGRPVSLGFGYGRNFGDTAPRAMAWKASWPAADEIRPWSGYLEPGQALLGDKAEAPIAWETASPRFGANTGRLAFVQALSRPLRLSVQTVGPKGAIAGRTDVAIAAGADSAEFNYDLERGFDSHFDVFNPQRVVLTLTTADGAPVYTASVPFGRHVGVCVDEPYGERALSETLARSATSGREALLQSVERALPRLERRTTQQGAPSDFCLVYENGAVAANLMADDAWQRLAGIVESRFSSADERLVGAMALIGQKSVTNLITEPLYFKPSGEEYYHSAMVEMLGPLSILRYGGGSAAGRAAALARLLQHITDPQTGRPFVTRVVSLTAQGGPAQTVRLYPGVTKVVASVEGSNLAPFVEVPGRIGAVAVDYRGSQTLLDPTALAFFPSADRLATVEEIRGNASLRREGAGRLAEIYGKLDIDELRHEPTDRLLSHGVFPEQCPEEDGADRPYTMGYLAQPPILVADGGKASHSAEFVDDWRRPGARKASVGIRPSGTGWKVTVSVRGVVLDQLSPRDRTAERVHVIFDQGDTHYGFRHFAASAAGTREAWQEESESIQTFAKHLATENWRQTTSLGSSGWKAEFTAVPGGYDASFEIPRAVLGLEKTPPVLGFNTWVEGRSPHYEQLFLAPPHRRLPADPLFFAELYTSAPPAVLTSVDLGVPTWMDNTGTVRLANSGDAPATVRLQATDKLAARRKLTASPAVTVTVPAHGTAETAFPYFLDPEEKMESGGAQRLELEASADGKVFYRSSWMATYGGPLSVYQRYGSDLGPQARPAPGDPYYVERMIRWISSRLPKFEKLTTRDGAESDFVLKAEDASARFNLMNPAAFDQMAAYVEGRFPTDLERLLAIYCLDLEPSIGRHNSGGHHLMARAQPISIMRGNFSGGGGNCGFHSALFAGLAAHLHIKGKLLGTRTVAVWGHDIMALDWRGSRVLIDDDVGNLMFTPDGKDLATIEEYRNNPWLLSNAGPGTIGRYYSFSEEAARSTEAGVGGVSGPGIFPETQVADTR